MPVKKDPPQNDDTVSEVSEVQPLEWSVEGYETDIVEEIKPDLYQPEPALEIAEETIQEYSAEPIPEVKEESLLEVIEPTLEVTETFLEQLIEEESSFVCPYNSLNNYPANMEGSSGNIRLIFPYSLQPDSEYLTKCQEIIQSTTTLPVVLSDLNDSVNLAGEGDYRFVAIGNECNNILLANVLNMIYPERSTPFPESKVSIGIRDYKTSKVLTIRGNDEKAWLYGCKALKNHVAIFENNPCITEVYLEVQ